MPLSDIEIRNFIKKIGPDGVRLFGEFSRRLDEIRTELIEEGFAPEHLTDQFIYEMIPSREKMEELHLGALQRRREMFERAKLFVRNIVGETISEDADTRLIVTKPGLVIVDDGRTFVWDERGDVICKWKKEQRIVFAERYREKATIEMRKDGWQIACNERELRSLASRLDPPWWGLSILQARAKEMGAPALDRIRRWDGGKHEGRMFPLDADADTLLLATGRGNYQLFEAQRDLRGYQLEGIASVRVDQNGNVIRLH